MMKSWKLFILLNEHNLNPRVLKKKYRVNKQNMYQGYLGSDYRFKIFNVVQTPLL